VRWLQPNNMDEWRAILAPVLYELITLVHIVNYVHDVQRLVIIGHEFSSHAIGRYLAIVFIIWSLCC
jgi:hypothetical protein